MFSEGCRHAIGGSRGVENVCLVASVPEEDVVSVNAIFRRIFEDRRQFVGGFRGLGNVCLVGFSAWEVDMVVAFQSKGFEDCGGPFRFVLK